MMKTLATAALLMLVAAGCSCGNMPPSNDGGTGGGSADGGTGGGMGGGAGGGDADGGVGGGSGGGAGGGDADGGVGGGAGGGVGGGAGGGVGGGAGGGVGGGAGGGVGGGVGGGGVGGGTGGGSALPTLSIDDVVVSEGNSLTTTALFTVTLSAPSAQTVTVDFATVDGTAVVIGSASTGGEDYLQNSGSVTFLTGMPLTQTVSVTVNGDTLNETSEAFNVILSNVANATLAKATGIGTITNDDAVPTLTIGNATVTEGNTGTTNAVFTVTLSAASGQTVTVNTATADGTATLAGNDYQSATGALTFAAGETTKQVTVQVNGDALSEASEGFTVALSTPVNATLVAGGGLGTITDDDPLPALSIDDLTQTEGANATTKVYTFTVTLSPASGQQVTVNYATANNSATAGSDYTAASGLVTFAAGETTRPIAVTVIGDGTIEADESFFVNLTTPVSATIAKAQGVGVLLNDDSPGPTMSIANVAVPEGNTGTTTATFTVTLSAPASQIVTVNYATRNGSANAGGLAASGGRDYDATNGVLSFPIGVVTRTFNVTINGDLLAEGNESYFADLSGAQNATIAVPSAQGIITNDDTQPSLSINDVNLKEGAAGQRTADFTVTLSAPSGQFVQLAYSTTNGTAVAGGGFGGNDYQAAGFTFINVPPGVTTQNISIGINGDTLAEGDDTFFVNLSNVINASVIDGQGLGTITNDDNNPTLSINDVSQPEGGLLGMNVMSFTATLSARSALPVSFTAATVNDTALAGSDYTASTGVFMIAPGSTSVTRPVTINGDLMFEPNETFFVDLSGATNATLAKARGIGTIANDDAPGSPVLTVNDVGVVEGNLGTRILTFTVTLNRPFASGAITVDFATADGSATVANGDYVAQAGSFNFPAGGGGAVFRLITVTINGDLVNEANDAFFVNLSNAVGATIVDGQGVGTIGNDDPQPNVSIGSATTTEGNAGSSVANFNVTLSVASGQTVTVEYTTANNTATALPGPGGSDYSSSSGTLIFLPGEVSKPFGVTINGDTTNEANEVFFVALSGATNAGIGTNPGTGVITNDDPLPAISVADVSQVEGNAGFNNALGFVVTLSQASGQTVTVNVATADGSAIAGSDYTARSGTLTFNPGVTTQTVNIPVTGDTTAEPNETFVLNLTAPINATISDAQGAATLVNDD